MFRWEGEAFKRRNTTSLRHFLANLTILVSGSLPEDLESVCGFFFSTFFMRLFLDEFFPPFLFFFFF